MFFPLTNQHYHCTVHTANKSMMNKTVSVISTLVIFLCPSAGARSPTSFAYSDPQK